MSQYQLLAIGEVMAELRRGDNGEFAVGFAGDTFNTAVYCARELGQQNAIAYLTHIGHDPLSSDLTKMASEEALDTSHIKTSSDKNLGIYAVSTDEKGERSFSYWRENSAARQLFSNQADIDSIPSSRVVYLSGITLAIMQPDARRRLIDKLASLSASKDATVAFDSNYRPKLWEDLATARTVMSEMWEIADIALPSIDDEMDLFGDATEDDVIARFAKRDWVACAVKRGERGPVSPTVECAGDSYPSAEKVVDTTAAGDSFNGGYLAAWLRGEDEAACLLSGHQLASQVVGHTGALIRR